MRTRSGTVSQSGLRTQQGDYGHKHITHPVLGMILTVYVSDDKANRSANQNQDLRGNQLEARVLVVNDGSDSPWILPNVVVTPNGSTGSDNFHEEIPRGTSETLDESHLPSNLTDISLQKLDGDWCIVDFIGGQIEQPFIARWWPHPANNRDGTTSGQNKTLKQGRRLVKRFQGMRFAVTSKGTVLVDTNESNHIVKKGKRVPDPKGGDIRVSVKPEREMELNWNPSQFGDPNEDDFLWPPNPQKKTRETTSTTIRFTKDEISAIAGEVVNIIAQRGDVLIKAGDGKLIRIGSTDDGSLESATLAETLTSFLNAFVDAHNNTVTAYNNHVHPIIGALPAAPPVPPSAGPPTAPGSNAPSVPDISSSVVKVKK